MGNWDDAVKDLERRKREATLICPRCGAMNKPGATIVELDEHGLAVCGVCSKTWIVKGEQDRC